MTSIFNPPNGSNPDLFSGRPSSPDRNVALPLHIEKTLGVPPLIATGVIVVGLVYCGLPILSSGGPLLDTLLHSQSSLIAFFVLAIMVVTMARVRRRGVLNIDAAGIEVTIGKYRSFYAWPDIDQVGPVKNAVRLDLKGRTPADNRFNLITTRFGPTRDQLATVIREGVARWGASTVGAGANASTTPSGRMATTSPWQSVRTIMVMPAIVFAGLFVWMTSSQVSDYMRTVDLRKNGVSASATVVRFYTDLCSRSGCDMNVEYAVAPPSGAIGAGKTFMGRGYLAGDDYENDADYQRAEQTHTVPVVYDRNDPSVSDLNLYNHIFARDPLTTLLVMLGVMGGAMLAGAGILALVFYVFLRRRLAARAQTA